jgi:hypothetical protein
MPAPSASAVSLKDLAEIRRAVRAQFAAASVEAGPVRPSLSFLLGLHLDYLAGRPAAADFLYGDRVSTGGERVLLERRRLLDLLLLEFRKRFVAAQKSGEIRAEVDPAMAAVHALGAIQMAWTFWTMGGRKGDPASTAVDLFDQLWDGIRR